MYRNITGLFSVLLLLLAPIVSVVAASCDCVHEEPGAPTLIPIPCCGPLPHPCCYDGHGEAIPASELVAEVPTNPRLPEPVFVEILKPFIPVNKFAQKTVHAPRSEYPPGALCEELNFRQTWLI